MSAKKISLSGILKHKTVILLAVVLCLGASLRLFRLSTVPSGLNWDEISHGYNAYSILKTGSDEWGQKFPLTNFRAYGDYPLPLNLYITMPFIAGLGLNEWAIRLPHALLGVSTILAAYFVAYGVTKKTQASLMVAFLVSIEPWLLFTSRFVLQSNLSIFFLTAGMAAFFNREKNKILLPLSMLFLGLTLFSYHSTRIFTPLLVGAMILIYRKQILTKWSIALLLLFFLPLPFILMNPEARARSTEVFLLNPGIVSTIEFERNNSTLPLGLSRLIYNRPVYLMSEFTKNYVGYFSPQFLFVEGGTQYQFSIPHTGVLNIIDLPFFYVGLGILFLKACLKKDKTYMTLAAWLLFAPIPASITTEHFAVVRATTMLPLPQILTALGLYWSIDLLKKKTLYKKIILWVFSVLSLFLLGLYLRQYFTSYNTDYSWAWQYGYKDVVSYVQSNYDKYDKIIITKKYGEPHEYILFYSAWDPSSYKNDPNLVRYNQSNWWWVDGFNKFVFVNDWQIPESGNTFITERKQTVDCSNLKCLLITSPTHYPKNWKAIQSVSFLDHQPAFEFYEN